MKISDNNLLRFVIIIFSTFTLLINCSGGDGDSSGGNNQSSEITVNVTSLSFGEVFEMEHSLSQSIEVGGSDILSSIEISVSHNFEVSLNNTTFDSQVSLNDGTLTTVYVRFSPQDGSIGFLNGTLTIQTAQANNKTVSLSGVGLSTAPLISSSNTNLSFGNVQIFEHSNAFPVTISGQNLVSDISIAVDGNFQISLDELTFTNSIVIPLESANESNILYVRFSPTEIGNISETLRIVSETASELTIALSGNSTPVIHNYTTFNEEALGFGGGFNQSAIQTFNLHEDLTNIAQIKMYLQIDCPSTGCDDWDRFANIKVKDQVSGDWFEIGRYITPYWVGTQQLERGLEFDVTDFKSFLTGATELRIYIENWTTKADLISIDFDYIEGTPDYPYYAVSEVLGFHANSISGVPYGVNHNLDLDKSILLPSNAESAHLRTIISGWGHATPNDSDGRPCAEWCYRTHDVKINGTNTFEHILAPIGCASNPISNQSPGNWTPDRAGWCPGMVVPVRSNTLDNSLLGTTFTFEYDFEDWVSDGNSNAFYATSTYVVLKSNTPISAAVVND